MARSREIMGRNNIVCNSLTSIILSILGTGTTGHPSLIVDGRASCGAEYDWYSQAYEIPDIKEGWYARRVSTCESPYWWMHWRVTDDDSQLYIAAISPEIQRFEDKLKFNAVLFGPSLDLITGESELWRRMKEGSLLERDVSPSIQAPEDLPSELRRGILLESPADLGSCAFVDENLVMRRFSDVINGRCMEQLEFEPTYKKNRLLTGTTQYSWWIYSREFGGKAKKGGVKIQPGEYYLVSWLSAKDGPESVSGKYEITIGPWTWYGYATNRTQEQARAQGTRCTCAVNSIDHLEQNALRIGFETSEANALWMQQLPYDRCHLSNSSHPSSDVQTEPSSSQCYAETYLVIPHSELSIEWVGWWRLKGGKRYTWKFRAFRSMDAESYEYPDAAMDVFVKEASLPTQAKAIMPFDESPFVEDVRIADRAMREGQAFRDVFHGDSLDLAQAKKQRIHFNTIADQRGGTVQTTVYLDVPITENSSISRSYAVFTQHRPAEFMAHFILDAGPPEQLVFPIETRLVGSNASQPFEIVYQTTQSPSPAAAASNEQMLNTPRKRRRRKRRTKSNRSRRKRKIRKRKRKHKGNRLAEKRLT